MLRTGSGQVVLNLFLCRCPSTSLLLSSAVPLETKGWGCWASRATVTFFSDPRSRFVSLVPLDSSFLLSLWSPSPSPRRLQFVPRYLVVLRILPSFAVGESLRRSLPLVPLDQVDVRAIRIPERGSIDGPSNGANRPFGHVSSVPAREIRSRARWCRRCQTRNHVRRAIRGELGSASSRVR